MDELRWLIAMLLLISGITALSYWLLQRDQSMPGRAELHTEPSAPVAPR
jgi:hypothetical protein